MRGDELRRLGPHPASDACGERANRGFSGSSWDEALDLAAERIREAGAERTGFYLTSRGMPNESYYAAQKAARAIGTNSIDNAARVCHSPSTFGLKEALGVAASTCSYSDWIGTDLIVFIGSNVANNQPVATKYLHQAKKAGTRVAVLNPLREPGMERYWIPSKAESALFGTKIADDFFGLNIGGDVAFLTGVLRHLIEHDWVDEEFVAAHTDGFGDASRCGRWTPTGRSSTLAAGATREDDARAWPASSANAKRGILVWSMGVTQHAGGEDGVRAIVNLALARGWVGKPGCGLMPIRGHSGVQGGAEMGCYSTALPGGAAGERGERAPLLGAVGVRGADRAGPEGARDAGRRAPRRARRPLLVGRQLPGRPARSAHASASRSSGRRFGSTWTSSLSSQMLAEPGEAVLILPAATRYEIPGRRHRDVDRAPRDPEPGDPGPAHRRGAGRVARCCWTSQPACGPSSRAR